MIHCRRSPESNRLAPVPSRAPANRRDGRGWGGGYDRVAYQGYGYGAPCGYGPYSYAPYGAPYGAPYAPVAPLTPPTAPVAPVAR